MSDCIIPKGYKETSLGVIPKEWEAVRIHEICTLVNGRAYKQDELLSEGNIRYFVLVIFLQMIAGIFQIWSWKLINMLVKEIYYMHGLHHLDHDSGLKKK